MFRVITISREYGSGGAAIAASLSSRLGWRLLDQAFLSAAASMASVDPQLARRCDERIDSWVHRVGKRALWHGTFDRLAPVTDRDFFDCETMAALSSEVILQASESGECVIVGRGAQCILQSRPDTFHVHIFAPMMQRVDRLRARLGDRADLESIARSVDETRGGYIKARHGCDWKDPHLYDLLINSGLGEECAVSAILTAAGLVSHPDALR